MVILAILLILVLLAIAVETYIILKSFIELRYLSSVFESLNIIPGERMQLKNIIKSVFRKQAPADEFVDNSQGEVVSPYRRSKKSE